MKNVSWQKILLHVLLVLNIVAICFVWYLGSGDLLRTGGMADILIAFGRLAGLFLEFVILVMLVMVSRTLPLERLYGFDKTNALHRTLGYGLLGFVLVHPLFLIWGYALQSDVGFWEQCINFIRYWHDVGNAFLAVFIMLVAGILSLPPIRRRLLSYEFWYFTHLPLYYAIALAFDHQTNTGDVARGGPLYYWLTLNIVVFGLLITYRFLIPLYKNWRHRFRVIRVVRESPSVVSLYLSGEHMDEFHFHAGQFARLIFFQKGLWQGHPFSFSAPPNGKELRFSIKALGDWTTQAEELRPGTRVWLEGPLGAFTLAQARTNSFLFIAGGIGITPILSMLRMLPAHADALFFHGVRSRDDLLFQNELKTLSLRQRFFLSEEQQPGYEHGRITLDRVKMLCPDFLKRDVYLCGPQAFMDSLIRDLTDAGVPKERLHYERFSF